MFTELKEAVNSALDVPADPIQIDDTVFELFEATLDSPVFVHSMCNDEFLEETMSLILTELGAGVRVYKPAGESTTPEEDTDKKAKVKQLKEEPDDQEEPVKESIDDILGIGLTESESFNPDEFFNF